MGIGVFAARRFGASTEVDILGNFEDMDPSLFHGFGVAFALSCLLGVPLVLFPSRRSFNFIVFGVDVFSPCTLSLVSVGLVLIACALAIASGSLLPIIDTIGSISAIAVDVALPGALFIRSQWKSLAQGNNFVADGNEHFLNNSQTPCDDCSVARSYRTHAGRRRVLAQFCVVGLVMTIGIALGVVSFVETLHKH